MKILAAIFWLGFILGSCAGCATLTEEQQAEHEYEVQEKELLRLEKFYNFERSCRRAGGTVQVMRRSVGSLPHRCMWEACPPNKYDQYSCVRL